MTLSKRFLLWVLRPVMADIGRAAEVALEKQAADIEALRLGAGFMKVSTGSVARIADGKVFRAST